MSVPPTILDLTVASSDRRPLHLWLPLFLLWPLALALAVLALVAAIVIDVVRLLLGRRYHHYSALLVRSFQALGEARGTVIRFSNERTAVNVTVR
jgi:hypothetical protein